LDLAGLTKIFGFLTNPDNNIYTNESRVTEAIGDIVNNFSIGEFQWDSANSTYKIPISHIVSSGNPVYVRIFKGIDETERYTTNSLFEI
jgi:hypothetical protein